MKKRLFPILVTTSLVAVVGLSFAQVLNKKAEEPVDPRIKARENASKVTEYKEKSRDNLKPYRYDASNVTHFSYSGFEQKREIEVLLFNGTDYKLVFNAQGAPKPVSIQIYDKPTSNQARVMIQEFANVTGQEAVTVDTKSLTAKYREAKKNDDVMLKRIYVDYIISANDTKEPVNGFMILTYGYKNI